MFLTDLQEKLREEQVKYGNVKLGHAHVGHQRGAVIDYYGDETDQPPEPKLTTIAEAEGVSGTLEERLKAAWPAGIVTVTGLELQQLLEYKAEALAGMHADEIPAPPPPPVSRGLEVVPAAMFIEAAVDSLKDAKMAMLVDQRKELHEAIGEVSIAYQQGYELGLQTARVCLALEPPTTKESPMEIPDLEGKGKLVRTPCPQFDDNKVACVLPYGHDGDHDFDPAHAVEAEQASL